MEQDAVYLGNDMVKTGSYARGAEVSQNLSDQAASVHDLVRNLNDRLGRLVVRIDGPRPEAVDNAKVPEPPASLRLSIERAMSVLNLCHNQLDELERHIG